MNLFQVSNQHKCLNKPLIFITGAPRSGTSMLTKVIDAHPDVAILMENIFENRRRHWSKANYWGAKEKLAREVSKVYSKLNTPIVGNKVCTPEIWSADDILTFCKLFLDFKIVFIVRDPDRVVLSRFLREDYEAEFNSDAKQNILLDFRSRFLTYTSSWRQSVETFWKLRDGYPDRVKSIYYEDFCKDFERQVYHLCEYLAIPFSEEMLNWQKHPHHDSQGNLKINLKYEDISVKDYQYQKPKITEEERKYFLDALSTIKLHKELWQLRQL
jgi:hypothetical protein